MSTSIIRPSSREEWLELRKNGIGSSEVGTIMGLNRFETPYQLWRRKMGMDAPKAENQAMRLGHYLEDAVAQCWMHETGREVIKRSAIDWIIRDNDKPYLQVSPDRTYWLTEKRSGDAKGILECKTTQSTIDADDLPKTWFCQLQYQLGVSQMPKGSLAWLSMGRDFGYVDMELVPDFYRFIVEQVDRFYTNNIIGGQEPAMTNAEDVLLKYRKHTGGKVVEVTENVYCDWQDLHEVRDRMAELEKRKEELESSLKMAFEDAESIAYQGETLATWKAAKDGMSFDYKTFQRVNPEACEPFMVFKPGVRRFILK